MIIKLKKSPRLLLYAKKEACNFGRGQSVDYKEVSFLFLEIVEELGNTRKCWLALAFYFMVNLMLVLQIPRRF